MTTVEIIKAYTFIGSFSAVIILPVHVFESII